MKQKQLNKITQQMTQVFQGHVLNQRAGKNHFLHPERNLAPLNSLYSEYPGKKVNDIKNFGWDKIDFARVVGKTKYSEPNLD